MRPSSARRPPSSLRRFAARHGLALADASRRWGRLWRRGIPYTVYLTNGINHPDADGMDLIKRLHTEFPGVAVLVLTMHAEDLYALRAFRAGANGYLTKDSAATDLQRAIRKVAHGGAFVTEAMAERLALGLSLATDTPAHEQLSDREFEVFRQIVAGRRLTDIADDLHLSIKTVSTHKSRVLEKLGVEGTAGLVRYGLQHRLF